MEDLKNAHAKVLKQYNLVRAIYAEIDFNTTDVEIFLTKSPSRPVLRKAMAERDDLILHKLLCAALTTVAFINEQFMQM